MDQGENAADLTNRDQKSAAIRWARTWHAAGLIRAATVMRASDLHGSLHGAWDHLRRRDKTKRH